MKWCTIYLVFALVFGAASLAIAQEKEKEKKGKLGEFVDDYEKNKDKKEKKDEENDSDSGGWLNLLVNIVFSPDDDRDSAREPRESGRRSRRHFPIVISAACPFVRPTIAIIALPPKLVTCMSTTA